MGPVAPVGVANPGHAEFSQNRRVEDLRLPSCCSGNALCVKGLAVRQVAWYQRSAEGSRTRRPAAVLARALRAVHAWLAPWITLRRWWAAWSNAPPPPQLQALISSVAARPAPLLPDLTSHR